MDGYWRLTKCNDYALVCKMFGSFGGNMVYVYNMYTNVQGYVIYGSIHWEEDVIFLGLIIGQIDKLVPVVANCLVSDLSYIHLCLRYGFGKVS